MENRAHALAAGVFVLLMALGLLAAAAWLQGDRTERLRYTVVARAAVSGLNVKAPVKLRGVEVGKVEDIRFDPSDARLILVDIAVDKAAPLSRSTYAKLGLQGVTGLSFVDLNDDGKGGPLLAAAGPGTPRIELRPTVLDQLSDAVPVLVADAAAITQRINKMLGESNQARLTHALEQAGAAAESLARLATQLQATAGALPPLLQRTDRAVAEVQGAAQQAGALAGDGRALLTEGRGLVAEFRQRTPVLDRLGAAAQQLESSTAALEVALVGPPGPRQRTRPLADEMAAASHAIEKLAQDLGEQPQSLILGTAARLPGPGESGFAARLAGAKP